MEEDGHAGGDHRSDTEDQHVSLEPLRNRERPVLALLDDHACGKLLQGVVGLDMTLPVFVIDRRSGPARLEEGLDRVSLPIITGERIIAGVGDDGAVSIDQQSRGIDAQCDQRDQMSLRCGQLTCKEPAKGTVRSPDRGHDHCQG